MESKRRRGLNFMPEEVEKLLELVEQHRAAIDEKRNSSAFLKRKYEAWEAVCRAYNADVSTSALPNSGPRTVEQLRVFYDNKKRRTKVLTEHNKTENMTRQTAEPEMAANGTHLQPRLAPNGTVGEKCPMVTDQELKIFDLDQNQSTLPSSESGGYFGDKTHEAEQIVVEVSLPLADNGAESKNQHPGNSSKHQGHEAVQPNTQEVKKKAPQTKGKQDYKELYFKRKCHNAYLERKKLNQEIELRKIEHNLKVKEHLVRIQLMQEEHERKMNY